MDDCIELLDLFPGVAISRGGGVVLRVTRYTVRVLSLAQTMGVLAFLVLHCTKTYSGVYPALTLKYFAPNARARS